MARIRTIKPDFCTSKDVGALSRDARLFFLQLLTEADDEGRLFWIPRRVAAVLYPHDDDVTPKLLNSWADECAKRGMVRIYETPAGTALQIMAWERHQRISHPKTSKIAPPSGDAPEALPKDSGNPPEVVRPEGEVEREVEQGMSGKPDRADDFSTWYTAYPRHEARDDALKAWEKRRKAKELPPLTFLLAQIEWQKREGCLKPAMADGRSLVPLPASYLNKGRFLDEPPKAFAPPPKHVAPDCKVPGCKREGMPGLGGVCETHYESPRRAVA